MKLTVTERWILSNQFKILAALYPEEANSYNQRCKIVERGYQLHYEWVTEYIYSGADEMTQEECRMVFDVLDMFSSIKRNYERIDDKSGIDGFVEFPGFDGNNEGKFLSYAWFLCNDEERFPNIRRGDHFNSHCPMLDAYERMIAEWFQSGDRQTLSKDELIRITKSAIHPDNRK